MADADAIRKLVGEHFEGMAWRPGKAPDWDRFRADFLPGAQLYPAARPVGSRSVEEFIDRMNCVAADVLETFEEHTTKMQVLQFGNIAVVLAASEMLENQSETNHDISGYLLVKSEGRWQIAAHAWDKVTDDQPIPDALK